MRSNTDVNVQSAKRIYYTRGRRFTRFMFYLLIGMFILWGLWMLYYTFQELAFAPLLLLFISVALHSIAYYDALTNTCVITSETGIEYQRPEFSVLATWSQIKSVRHNPFLSILGLNYYLLLEAPTISYTKRFGWTYKFQPGHILFPNQQKRIPIGSMWESSKQLENEIRAKVPNLTFESSRPRIAG